MAEDHRRRIALAIVFLAAVSPTAPVDGSVAEDSSAGPRRAGVDFNPNDPRFPEQWGPPQARLPDAWDLWVGGHNILVATLDEGVDVYHEDLKGNLYQARSASSTNAQVVDFSSSSHGSSVAGVAAAMLNDQDGIAGVVQSRLYSVKWLDYCDAPGATPQEIAQAISNAQAAGVKVFSISASMPDENNAIADALTTASNNGALIFASSGNAGTDSSQFPANHTNVISIGAVNQTGQAWSGNSRGSHVKLAAPGGDVTVVTTKSRWTCDGSGSVVYDPLLPGYYDTFGGTSAAAPFAAGVAAALWSFNPTLSNTQIRDLLVATADDIPPTGWDNSTGYGRVNLTKALLASKTAHGPIEIIGDADFCDGDDDGVVNCATADGSESKPYEVSGWLINTTSSIAQDQGLLIRDTSKNFTIKGNIIADPHKERAKKGVVIEASTATKGTIERNILSNNQYGIWLDGASPIVKENAIANNSKIGIEVRLGSPRINQNNIYANKDFGLRVPTNLLSVVDASFNYWGNLTVIQSSRLGSDVTPGALIYPYYVDFARSTYLLSLDIPQGLFGLLQDLSASECVPTNLLFELSCNAPRWNRTRFHLSIPAPALAARAALSHDPSDNYDLYGKHNETRPSIANEYHHDWVLNTTSSQEVLRLAKPPSPSWYSFTVLPRNATKNFTFSSSSDHRPDPSAAMLETFPQSTLASSWEASGSIGSGETVAPNNASSVSPAYALLIRARADDSGVPWASREQAMPHARMHLSAYVRIVDVTFQNFTLLNLQRVQGGRLLPLLNLTLSDNNTALDATNGTSQIFDVKSLLPGRWHQLSLSLGSDRYSLYVDRRYVGSYALQSIVYPWESAATAKLVHGGEELGSSGEAFWDDITLAPGHPLRGDSLWSNFERGRADWVLNPASAITTEKSSQSYARSQSARFTGNATASMERSVDVDSVGYLARADFRIVGANLTSGSTTLLKLLDGQGNDILELQAVGSSLNLTATSGKGRAALGSLAADSWHRLGVRSFGTSYALYLNETFLGRFPLQGPRLPTKVYLGGSNQEWLVDNVLVTHGQDRLYESFESGNLTAWLVDHQNSTSSLVEVQNLSDAQSARTIGKKLLHVQSSITSPTRAMLWRAFNGTGDFRAETMFYLPNTALALDHFYVLALNESATMKVGVALKEAADDSIDVYLIGNGWQSNIEAITRGDWHRIAIDVAGPNKVYVWVGETKHGPYNASLGTIDTLVLGDVDNGTSPLGPIGAGEGYWDDVVIQPLNRAPTVGIDAPAPNATVSGTVEVRGSALDSDTADAPRQVEVRIDQGSWQPAVGVVNWTYSWDTTQVANGSHTIRVRASDGRDWSDVVERAVSVSNP